MVRFYIQAIDADYVTVYLDNKTLLQYPSFSSFNYHLNNIFYFYNLKAVRKFIKRSKKFFPNRIRVSYKICVQREV